MMSEAGLQQYRHFAQIYDKFLAHVDYTMWANYILALWNQKHIAQPREILDLACGTGELIREFVKKNIKVTGLDISENMLDIAAEKISDADSSLVQLGIGDIRDFSFSRQFDMVVCAFDSVNYIAEPEELRSVYANIFKVLSPEGMFIFDVATPLLCENYYDSTSETQQYGKIRVGRKSEWQKRKKELITEFTFENMKTKSIEKEIHVQRIYTSQELIPMLKDAGYRKINAYSDFSKEAVQKDTLRIHYTVEK